MLVLCSCLLHRGDADKGEVERRLECDELGNCDWIATSSCCLHGHDLRCEPAAEIM